MYKTHYKNIFIYSKWFEPGRQLPPSVVLVKAMITEKKIQIPLIDLEHFCRCD